MDRPLAPLTDALLEAAKTAGADAADAVALEGTSISIDVRAGALEQAERSESIDVGLRVMIGQRQACVSSSETTAETFAEMAARAVAMAREAPEDPGVMLAPTARLAREIDMTALDLLDPADEPAPADLEARARTAEASALAHQGISMVEAASCGYSSRRVHLATSAGFSAGYGRTDSAIFCVAITGSGTEMERDYFGESRTHRADLPSPEEVGRIAAERTLARAGARKPPTGPAPILYDERIASGLIGHLVAAANGASIVRGASWLTEAMGEQVLPKGLSLLEEPRRPRVSGSRLYDGEGLPTATRALVEDGVLQSWILDLSTAAKLGLDSTANASRSVSAPPSPSAGNLRLTQGDTSREALLSQMGTGLLLTSLIGATINPTTGDYSRGASGFWVENGEVAYPVNECTIAGNLREMLRTIVPANDARPHLGRVVPSLLVEGLTIAGA
ncbi:MAG: metallopeptidase TldD-related protein [Pseudomonadota bacterium]